MTTGRIEVGPTGRAVAANVKRLRKARGLSLRALSAALKDRGRTLSADALNKIENAAEPDGRGVRRVDVDDLAALAVAFDVPPSALLLPLDDSSASTVDVTGVGSVPADVAWDWLDGKRPLELPSGDDLTPLLEFDLYGRPPRRRGTWSGLRNLIQWGESDPEAEGTQLAQRLRDEDPGSGGGGGGAGLD
ncbi:helix-turn-helix domain-containing protein [Streptomyces dysideae]|nr:helix-turn-helix transcriptional regulator [Streptomyces dysideae]